MSLPKKTILGHMDCLGLELTNSNDEIKTNHQIFQFEGEDKQERVSVCLHFPTPPGQQGRVHNCPGAAVGPAVRPSGWWLRQQYAPSGFTIFRFGFAENVNI